MTHRIVVPIRPENRWLYPIDWRELSLVIRFGRARGRCERCRRPHGVIVPHLGDGRWWDAAHGCWRDGCGRRVRGAALPAVLAARRNADQLPLEDEKRGGRAAPALPTTRVVLASAHLDHDPGNNHPRNLAALCQRCHLAHDRAEHRRRRWTTLFRRRALGDLFLGIYR